MTNPTGAFVYDIEEETQGPEAEPTRLSVAITRNKSVLGKAVHPMALLRLHELWPQAKAFVRHHWIEPTPEEALDGIEGRRITEVWIVKYPDDPDSPQRGSRAIKHPNDKWDRRHGIELAFRRALRAVKAHEDQAAWRGYEGAKP